MTTVLGPNYGTIYATNYEVLRGSTSLGTTKSQLSQRFSVTGPQTLHSIDLYLKKTGLPPGNLSLEIRYDASGDPAEDGPANNVSAIINAGTLTTTAALYKFTFTDCLLEDGTNYHWVLSSTGVEGTSNYTEVAADNVLHDLPYGQRDNLDGTWYNVYGKFVYYVYYLEQVASNPVANEIALLGTVPGDCDGLQAYVTQLANILSAYYPGVLPATLGGTGAGVYERGDILYATDPSHLERLSIGTSGELLSVSDDGIPEWGGSGSVLKQSYINNSGAILYPGDLVVFDPTLANAVTKSTDVNAKVAGIVSDIVLVGSLAPVTTVGVSQVRINSTVANNDVLHTSPNVAGRAEVAYDVLHNTSIYALQSGVSGDLINVYINVATQNVGYQPEAYRIADFVATSYALVANVWKVMSLQEIQNVGNTLNSTTSLGFINLDAATDIFTITEPGFYQIKLKANARYQTSTSTSYHQFQGFIYDYDAGNFNLPGNFGVNFITLANTQSTSIEAYTNVFVNVGATPRRFQVQYKSTVGNGDFGCLMAGYSPNIWVERIR